MANTDGAFGLRPVHKDARVNKYAVTAGASKIHIGTPVLMAAGGTASVGTAAALLLGVAVGFFDDEGVPQSYYPGGSVTGWHVMVADDPRQEFVVQEDSTGGALALTDRGLNADLVAGTGNDYTGLSGWELDSSTADTTDTLQCRIIDLYDDPDNAVGNYAKWVVRINYHFHGDNTAGI